MDRNALISKGREAAIFLEAKLTGESELVHAQELEMVLGLLDDLQGEQIFDASDLLAAEKYFNAVLAKRLQ